MKITITIADKLTDDVARTYSYDAASGKTLEQHIAERFANQIYEELRENIKNIKREQFADSEVDALLKADDVTPDNATK